VLLAALASGCHGDPDRPVPAATASSAGSASAAPSAAPVVAEAVGRSLVENNCLGCHAADMIAQQRLTAKQWANVVKKMHGWGAPVEPENIDPLIAYLAAHQGPSAAPYTPATISAAEAARAVDPLPDGPFARGDAKRGLAAYHDLCAPCHARDGRGAELGVNLVDRPLLYRSTDFARAVRSGRGRMPGFKDMGDAQIADLLAHLRSPR
jgi:mono/diheme cytochrome c family protein